QRHFEEDNPMSSPSGRVPTSRRERAQQRAKEIRKALGHVDRAEARLEAERERRQATVAAADEKVAARTADLDQAIERVATMAGTDQIAADLLDLPVSRIRAARASKNASTTMPAP